MVADTCRYSSGPLIPNSATAIVWNIGINCLATKISAGVGYLPCFFYFYLYDPNWL